MTLRAALIFSALISLFVFPAPVSAALALAAAFVSPLSAVALGVLADMLYFTPQTYAFWLYTVLGALTAIAAFLARRFVETRIVR